MKNRRFLCLLMVLVLLTSVLAGCSCSHEWAEANCKSPKTCTLCGETEGEKTDTHQWEDATTEAPKTCSVCGLTEGERIITDERFTTAACKALFGTWTGTVSMNAEEMGMTGSGKVEAQVTYTFTNDGKMECTMALKDVEGYAKLMEDMMYKTFADQGMSKDEADSAMQEVYGMGVEEFCMETAQTVADSFAAMDVTMVYYVADGKIFEGLTWDDEMTGAEFSVENGVLSMIEDGIELQLNRVNEE